METWKIGTIVLTGVSLLWNVANTLYTRSSNRKNTKRLVNLEEFRSRVRDPLDGAMRDLETVLRNAEQLAQHHPDFPGGLKDELITQNQSLMNCMTVVKDRLADAEESKFADDIDWLDLFDPAEDQIMQHMNDYLDEKKSKGERAKSAMRCKESFRIFKKKVTSKIESQIANLS